MKNTPLTAGALGLTAALLLGGLATGPTSIAAAAAAPDGSVRDAAQLDGTDATPPETTADTDVDTDVALAELTTSALFSPDVSVPMQIVGTGRPGAHVEGLNGGMMLSTGADDVTGAYTLNVPAPDAGGVQEYTVWQSLDGELDIPSITSLTADYGDAVSVTSPVDGAAHAGGPVSLTGTGVDGGRVEIREDGVEDVLARTTVLADGTWTATVPHVDGRRHTLVATQTGKGFNVTVSATTVNPHVEDVAAPTVETPAAGSTVTSSRPVFTGHGEDRATVTIGYGPRSIIGTAVVTGGEWTITPGRGLGMGTSHLVVTQTTGADVQTLTHTVHRIAADLPLAVTSHADGQTYAAGMTTFRGTAAVGATIRATNQWGTAMGTATATDGTWSFGRNLGPTSAGYDITFVATKGTETQRTALHLDHAVVNQSVAVTSHADGATYRPGLNVLTGTGTPGAGIVAVNATNSWNVPMGRATVGTDGSWALPERNWGPSNDYLIQVTQTNPDKSTGTMTIAVQAPVFTAPSTVTFPDDVDVTATLSGTAAPGTRVVATTPDGEKVAEATSDARALWSSPLTPPNAPGAVTLDVVATTPAGVVQTTTSVADFGDAVSIATPADGHGHPGGRLEFTGTGEAGARVHLTRGVQILDGGTVSSDGSWTLSATIGAADIVYEVVQTGRGSNTTRDAVAITAEEDGAPLIITSPAAGSTTLAPSGRVTFRGTGEPGAVLTIRDESGTDLATRTIGSTGTFTLTAQLLDGTNDLTLRYALEGEPAQDIPHSVRIITGGS